MKAIAARPAAALFECSCCEAQIIQRMKAKHMPGGLVSLRDGEEGKEILSRLACDYSDEERATTDFVDQYGVGE